MGIEVSNFPFTPDGALRVGGEHGRYYEAVARGNTFIQTTTVLGLAIPIYTATAPRVALFNPLGSGVNASLMYFAANKVSGTPSASTVGLMRVEDVGAGPATGTPVTVMAGTTPFNGLIGDGNTSKTISMSSGTITTTAGAATDFFYSLFHMYAAVDASTPAPAQNFHDFNGRVVVPPGTMIWLAGDIASVALFATTLAWEEVPV